MVIDVLRNIRINRATRMNQYLKRMQNIVRRIEKQKQIIKYIIVIIFNFLLYLVSFLETLI